MRKGLLERDVELDLLDARVDRAARGEGAILLVRGAPGIGKTVLLDAAAERWTGPLLRATASPLERDHPYSLVLALAGSALGVDPALRDVAGRAVCGLVDGAEDLGGLGPPDARLAVERGLRRLLVALAGAPGGLLIVADDAHWADAASLRALALAAPDVAAAGGLLLIATRPSEDAELAWLARIAIVVEPRPLGQDAAEVLAAALGGPAAAALLQRTAGNPLLVVSLVEHVLRTGVAVDDALPGDLVGAVAGRLAELDERALAVARAAAVLAPEASLHRVAALAGLDLEAVAEATDELVAAHVLAPSVPLRFAHPVVADATLAAMPAAAQGLLRLRAARLLHDEGVRPALVGAHLLAAPACGEAWAVQALVAAGLDALAHGDPPTAGRLLRRALEEGPEPALRERAALALARAAAFAGDPDARERLDDALAGALPAPTAVLLLIEHGDAQVAAGRPDVARDLLVDARTRAADGAVPDELRAYAVLAAATAAWLHGAPPGDRTAAALRRPQPAAGAGPLEQAACDVSAAAAAALAGAPDAPAGALARDGLGRLTGIARLGGGFLAFMALGAGDTPAALHELIEDGTAWAREIGSPLGIGTWLAARAILAWGEGDLDTTLELGGRALALEADGWDRHAPALRAALSDVHAARGESAAALAVLDGPPERWADRVDGFALPLAAAWLAEPARAVSLAREAGRRAARAGVVTPAWAGWRGVAARALVATDPAAAHALVDEQLALARTVGSRRAVGQALAAAGAVRRDPALLEEAVDQLAASPARLEQARAELTLGVVLLRAGQRVAARGPLHAALRTATICGADGLVAQAHVELRAAGGRRRPGAAHDELTAAELRVARLAAAGAANGEIAAQLFVGRRTVEMHLSRAYRKLGIPGRAQLRDALAD